MSTDTNGVFTEAWLGKLPSGHAIGFAACSMDAGGQVLFIAGSDGTVRPLVLGPPQWQWQEPIFQRAGIAGITAYAHPADGRTHCFVADSGAAIWEVSFTSLADRSSLKETWLGGYPGGASPVGIAGVSSSSGKQNLFIAGQGGFVRPLELGPSSNWTWSWAAPIMQRHDEIAGISAHYHAGDNALHVFVTLTTGDVWEAVSRNGTQWVENWIGVLDGGAIALAGHSAANDTQHLFAASPSGWILPVQIGPPHWKWRWDNRVMERHDGVAGLASYFHRGDGQQHVFAALHSGDIWESRFRLRSQVATREWNPIDFPISYWVGPREVTDQADALRKYQQAADAGFNFAISSWEDTDQTPAMNKMLLAACGSLGMRIFVYDISVALALQAGPSFSQQTKDLLGTAIAAYSGHSAFAGYTLTDENLGDLQFLGQVVSHLRSNDPGHGSYINIVPSHAGGGPEYIENYVNTVRPFVISYDHYSLLADGTDESTYFQNLHIVRDKAFQHQLPFWQFALSTRHAGYRKPTEAEKRYEAMQLLAFGGKGLLWFTYWLPPYPDFFEAIVSGDGTPTGQYEEVKRIHADVRAIGKYLLNAPNIAVYENGTLPVGGVAPAADAMVKVLGNADVTVGLFSVEPVPRSSSANKFYALLASRDYKNDISTKVRFAAITASKLDKISGKWSAVASASGLGSPIDTSITLSPGDAELFQLFTG